MSIAIFITWNDIDVTLADPPVSHGAALYMIKFMKEHSGREILHYLLVLLAMFVQVADLHCLRSFDHTSHTWEAETVLPVDYIVCGLGEDSRVDERLEVSGV